jgi:chromosome segregation ATPase
MARTTKSAEIGQRTARARKPGRPAAASAKPAGKGRTSKSARASAAPKRTAAALPQAPKLSKDELRAQVEKLERANATLRAKSRETNRAAKSAAARIAELEGEVARLEKRVASQSVAATRGGNPRTSAASKRRSSDLDPGDAVPPGVAVDEPAPLDLEAEAARESLEERLGGE